MGNHESIVDPEIRALTQLVSSFIQKRSSLHYQINQLKLAQNTKKTCIETKKLRDLKVKNSNLVVEIKNSEKILDKIRQKKFIKAVDKDLSSHISHFCGLLYRKKENFNSTSMELSDSLEFFDKRQVYLKEREVYSSHLLNKKVSISKKLEKFVEIMPRFLELQSEVEGLREKLKELLEKKSKVEAKKLDLAGRRRLKRRQTLVVPKLTQNAFVLRSKLLLKSELMKQLDELKADQDLHIEQQNKIKANIEIVIKEEKKLVRLNTNRDFLESKVILYKSELENFQMSPLLISSPMLPLAEVQDSLDTEFDFTSESFIFE